MNGQYLCRGNYRLFLAIKRFLFRTIFGNFRQKGSLEKQSDRGLWFAWFVVLTQGSQSRFLGKGNDLKKRDAKIAKLTSFLISSSLPVVKSFDIVFTPHVTSYGF